MESYGDINVGQTYKNFRGYERVVKEIHEMPNHKIRITYDDFTGKFRTCEYGTFVEWIKKKYY